MMVMGIVLWAGQGQAADQINAAVLEFAAGNEVAPALASSVGDYIHSGLVQSGRFNMMDRKNVENVLKEQGFQKSGCTTAECAVEIGKLLNVRKMVVGNVSKVGSRYVISIGFIDVESGKTELSDDVECDSQELIKEASSKLAEHFSRSVEFTGNVLSADKDGKVGSEIVIDLGSRVNVDEKTTFQIKRLKEVVGKFKKYTVIGEAEVKEIQSEGSSAIVKKVIYLSKVKTMENGREVETEVGVKEKDVVVFVETKLPKRLDPILTKGRVPRDTDDGPRIVRDQSPTKGAEGDSGRGRLYVGSMEMDDYLVGTENSVGTLISPKTKAGKVGKHALFGMEFGWTESPALDFGFPIMVEVPELQTTGVGTAVGTKIPNVSLLTGSMGFLVRFFPLSGSTDRGSFRPYVAGGGNVMLGLLDPDTTSSAVSPALLVGYGGMISAGCELGPIFFELFTRPTTFAQGKYKATTASTTSTVTEFRFSSMGVVVGFCW